MLFLLYSDGTSQMYYQNSSVKTIHLRYKKQWGISPTTIYVIKFYAKATTIFRSPQDFFLICHARLILLFFIRTFFWQHLARESQLFFVIVNFFDTSKYIALPVCGEIYFISAYYDSSIFMGCWHGF